MPPNPPSGVPDPSETRRIPALDGLRGIAAFAVVLSHVGTMVYAPYSNLTPTHLSWSLWHLGAPAVEVFFILSGYVVALSIQRRPKPYWEYLWRRWLRLAPLAYVGVLLGYLIIRPTASWLGSPADMTQFMGYLTEPLTTNDLLGSIFLFYPVMNANHINPPLWTLVIELQTALFIPLFARLSPLWLPLIFIIAALWGAYFYNAHFLFTFALGAALTKFRPSKSWAMPLLTVGLVLLLHRHVTGWEDILSRLVTAIPAAMVVMGVATGAGATILNHHVFQWLGKISYPLYASHFAVLIVFAAAAHKLGFSPMLGAALGVPPALYLSHILEITVERPIVNYLARKKRNTVSVEDTAARP